MKGRALVGVVAALALATVVSAQQGVTVTVPSPSLVDFDALKSRIEALELKVFPPPPPPPPAVQTCPNGQIIPATEVCPVVVPPPVEPPPVEPVPGLHPYYEAQLARPEFWKAYSLRDPALLAGRKYLTYDAVEDAMRVTVPPFFATTTLAAPMAADALEFVPVDTRSTLWPTGRTIRIDGEVLTVAGRVNGLNSAGATVLVAVKATRAQLGTVSTTHDKATAIEHATNTLQSKMPLPLGTEDGHSYVFVYDAKWSDAFLPKPTDAKASSAAAPGAFGHKAFQFFSGGRDLSIWFEPQANYGRSMPYVAGFAVRSYNQPGGVLPWTLEQGNKLGPGVTAAEPITPRGSFSIAANTWTRFIYRFVQRANDYDVVDAWACDETRDCVPVLEQILVSVRPTGTRYPNTISHWQPEFNSSTDVLLRTDLRDYTAWVRNFVALRDLADVTPLLVRPVVTR
jgi:hypothetical protein